MGWVGGKSNIRSPRALLQLAVTLTQNGNGHITYLGELGEEPPPPAPYCLNCETHKTERGELGGHTVPPTTFRAANVPSNTLCFTQHLLALSRPTPYLTTK